MLDLCVTLGVARGGATLFECFYDRSFFQMA